MMMVFALTDPTSMPKYSDFISLVHDPLKEKLLKF